MEQRTATEIRGRPHPATVRPTLVFVRQYRSGASRRMESLVAWVKVTRKKQLTVLEVDADRHPGLVRRLGVTTVPSLVLVKDRRTVGRLEGRVTGRQIDDLIGPHLEQPSSAGSADGEAPHDGRERPVPGEADVAHAESGCA